MGFAAKAVEKKLTAGEPREFCYFVPVLYVRKGNPKAIADVADLVKPGLKLALAAESSAVGQLQTQLFKKNKLDLEALRKNTVTSPATVMDVALAVKLGTADAAIIWDAFSDFAPDDAEAVRISPDKNVVGTVALCPLAGAKNPAAAKAFADFLLSEKGKAVLKARKFTLEKPGQ
jgi:molybdate transport system substrate-binding protein